MSMRWLTITLAALGAFAPVSLWAYAEKCGPLFTSEYSEGGRIEVLPSGSKGPKATEYSESLKRVNLLLGDLLVPHEVTVSVDHVFMFSTYSFEQNIISVGIRPDSMGKKHPSVNLNTLVHEYGHAIFEKNLMNTTPIYRALRESLVEIERSQHLLELEVSTFNQHLKAEQDVLEKESLQTHIKDLKLEIHRLEVLKESKMNHWNIRAAVHELFADIVAVTASKNPRALRDTLNNIEDRYDGQYKEHSSVLLNLRNFADGAHHKNRQTWNKEHAKIVQDQGDIYYAFLPARWEFWQLVKGRIESPNYQKEVIPKVFSILEKHLNAELEKSAAELRPSGFKNIEELNNKIIQDFKNEL